MKKYLILKPGTMPESIVSRWGDYEQLIASGMNIEPDDYSVVEVFSENKLPDVLQLRGIIITGSPSNVTECLPWMRTLTEWIKRAITVKVPILGICFGHQILAHAAGGEVSFNPKGREIGSCKINLTEAGKVDPLLGGLQEIFTGNNDHSQSVLNIPQGAMRLAFNDHDKNHAFRLGDWFWGIQFHPEFSKEIMNEYIDLQEDNLKRERFNLRSLKKKLISTDAETGILERFGEICEEKERPLPEI